jgi:hypothetical protein
METMRSLIAKYPDGYEGWAKERGIPLDNEGAASRVNASATEAPLAPDATAFEKLRVSN